MKIYSMAFLVLILFLSANALLAQEIQSGKYSINNTNPNYTLDKSSGDRSMTIVVNFDKGFEKKPSVMLSVTKVDAGINSNIRYNVEAISVSRDGFTIKISTWSDSIINGIAGNWVAISEK